MSLWGLNKKPTFYPSAIATHSGWCDPVTGEVIVAIGQLPAKAHDEADDNLTLGDDFDLILSPAIPDVVSDLLLLM